MPASSTVACGSAPAAEQARTSAESTGTSCAAVRLSCASVRRPRVRGRWPPLDRRSVTTAGVAMVPRSVDQRLVVSAVHDVKPST